MAKYELTIIARENLTVVDKMKIDEMIKGFVDRKRCKVEGVKTLSYPINHQEQGLYIFYELWGESVDVVKINHELGENDNVLRFLLVKTDVRG